MKNLQLPRMSTDKPLHRGKHSDNGDCSNHLHQEFNQKAPNIVWTSDFAYIKVGNKWYYLCIVMDLFSRSVISLHISGKLDVDLVLTAFKKAYDKRNSPLGCLDVNGLSKGYNSSPYITLFIQINTFIKNKFFK